MDHYYELITTLATVSLTKHFQWNKYIFALIFNALPRVTIKLKKKMYINSFLKKLIVTRWKFDNYVLILLKMYSRKFINTW